MPFLQGYLISLLQCSLPLCLSLAFLLCIKKKGKAFPATHHFILAMPKPSSELAQIVFVCPKSMKYSGKTREGQIQGIYSELPVLHLKMAQFFSMISSTV